MSLREYITLIWVEYWRKPMQDRYPQAKAADCLAHWTKGMKPVAPTVHTRKD